MLGALHVYVVRFWKPGCTPRVPRVVRSDDEFDTWTRMSGTNRAKIADFCGVSLISVSQFREDCCFGLPATWTRMTVIDGA